MNSITITGRVGQEPRQIPLKDEDKTLVVFSIADRQYSKANGDFVMWVDVQVWGARAETALKAITKGREVTITGRLVMSREYVDKKGVTRVNPAIRLESFHLCGSKPAASDEFRDSDADGVTGNTASTADAATTSNPDSTAADTTSPDVEAESPFGHDSIEEPDAA